MGGKGSEALRPRRRHGSLRRVPRLFPPHPEFGKGRYGEQAVWDALRSRLPDDAAVFYSRWVVELENEEEVDFLVAWPGVGLACIEVKGGHVERDAQDQWWSVARDKKKRL